MAIEDKHILNRLYFVSGIFFVFALAVLFKLLSIQFMHGEKYRDMAEKRTVKNVVIPANRGNVYSADGNLLATSIPKYDIRFDALTPTQVRFDAYVKALSDSLSVFTGKPSSHFQKELRKARINKNRYFLVARNLSYSNYIRVRNFPLLELGAFKGGLIVEQTTKREHPMGGIAERSIGYERFDDDGKVSRAGIDGAFGVKYLRGTNGLRMKQRIGNGQWKPIADYNQIDPKDGYDVFTTIDANIQDIAHHSLLGQLEFYQAEHGCAVVMDVQTGEIKAISNLGRNTDGKYYERLNYAVGESHEPGSTFKVMALMAALEDGAVDTSTIVDTRMGSKPFYGRTITDSRGHGKISAARALELSSNIGLATIIDDYYSKEPQKFIDRLKAWHLNDTLGISIRGEGMPVIPEPGHKLWSKNALPSMAYGYNLRMTPLQTLTFYNAIANDGEMVKPRFIRAVKEFDREVEVFDKKVINPKICSDQTLSEIREILKNVIVRGTGSRMYSENFSMAGKTGTARTEYWMDDWSDDKRYISSFVGYFPAENPKYSCIVVIHKPSNKVGYYGADVSGPVFKKIAQKIYTDTPLIDEVESLEFDDKNVTNDFNNYYQIANTHKTIMPLVVGMPVMDALSLLENMDVHIQIELKGNGVVKRQSIAKGVKLSKNQQLIIEAI